MGSAGTQISNQHRKRTAQLADLTAQWRKSAVTTHRERELLRGMFSHSVADDTNLVIAYIANAAASRWLR